jgi:hypothetical protein
MEPRCCMIFNLLDTSPCIALDRRSATTILEDLGAPVYVAPLVSPLAFGLIVNPSDGSLPPWMPISVYVALLSGGGKLRADYC